MDEIRIGRKPGIEPEDGAFRDGGKWYVDAVEIRGALALIVAARNERHGEDSHWIERRAASLVW